MEPRWQCDLVRSRLRKRVICDEGERTIMWKSILVFVAVMSTSFAAELATNRIDEITGLKGKWNPEERVYKVSSPRADIKVTVDNWQMPPFMGLTSWAAFTTG